MNFKIFFCVIISLISSSALCTGQNDPEKLLKTYHSISSHELLDFTCELTADKYKGRLSGSPEYMEVAKWCAGKFKDWGIQPANKGSYFQYFPNPFSEVFTKGEVIYSNEGNNQKLEFQQDYFPGSNSDSGTVKGELVYVGHGITAPELDYDDYKNVDVKGKIIILESGTPYTKNDTTLAKWTPYAYHRYKFRNAVTHGAAGMIYVSKIANPNTVNLPGFIYAHVDQTVVEKIFSDGGRLYAETKQALKEMKNPSFEFGSGQQITISAKTKYYPNAQSCNVLGLIMGSDPELKDEVIIIGGHLDGVGYLGEVFPGALDNASGVADILGAAKALAESEIRPRRSILFILIGGEECGLYGSKHYVDNPLFDIEKTKLMINLDMVGNGTGFFISGGKSYPEIFRHFENANDGFIHRPLDSSEKRIYYGRPRSDASNFENTGITTFGLWTRGSVHPVYYHHPLDETNVLTPEIMEDAAKLIYLSVLSIANDESL